jgi:UDP-glucose:tetrahydrobiopterin glucosyltransferase
VASTKRILICSTPVGPLGSGMGGGVELTLHSLVVGLTARGHQVEVVAPAGSVHESARVHEIPGALQTGAQNDARTAPVTMPATRCSRRCGRGCVRTSTTTT